MAEKTTTVAGDAATNDMEGLNRTLSFVLDVKVRPQQIAALDTTQFFGC